MNKVIRSKFVIDLQLVIHKRGKYLLARRQNTGYMDGYFGLIAGHLEENESLIQGIHREAMEEIGIKLSISDTKLIHLMHRSENDNRLTVFFEVLSWDGEIRNLETEKCSALEWFSIESLPQNTVSFVKLFFDQYRSGTSYSEIGW